MQKIQRTQNEKALIVSLLCLSVIKFNTTVYAENRATTISTQIEPMYEVIIPSIKQKLFHIL